MTTGLRSRRGAARRALAASLRPLDRQYLMGRHADALGYRADVPRGLGLYCYETMPRLYGQFLAYMLRCA
jgi:hypothetical protein